MSITTAVPRRPGGGWAKPERDRRGGVWPGGGEAEQNAPQQRMQPFAAGHHLLQMLSQAMPSQRKVCQQQRVPLARERSRMAHKAVGKVLLLVKWQHCN